MRGSLLASPGDTIVRCSGQAHFETYWPKIIRGYSLLPVKLRVPASLGTLLGVFEDPIPFHGIMNGTDRMRDRRP